MRRRNPPAKWVLPSEVDPSKSICVTIHVPRERFHVAAFRGAMLNLASAYKWQDDDAHTARDVANVWKRVIDGMSVCPDIPIVPDSGEEWEDCEDMAICQSLRFHNGKLQGFCCGEWVDIDGQGGVTVGGSGQPGGGSPQPAPGGGSECYHGNMTARDEWLVPALVSSGDTVELKNVTGAGTDGSPGVWRCANGQVFFAGACVGVETVTGTDPASAVGHMRLVFQIDGTYYDAMAGAVTVPGGVTNAEVIVQVNDTTLSDNSGSYSFDACVTNNGANEWSSFFDFTLNPYSSILSIVEGSWSAGQGYVGANVTGNHSFIAITTLEMGVAVKNMDTTYNCAGHSGAQQILAFWSGTGGYLGTPTTPTTGTNLTYPQVIEATANQPGVQVGSGDDDGPCLVKNMTISGYGDKPAGWP